MQLASKANLLLECEVCFPNEQEISVFASGQDLAGVTNEHHTCRQIIVAARRCLVLVRHRHRRAVGHETNDVLAHVLAAGGAIADAGPYRGAIAGETDPRLPEGSLG